MTTLGNEEWHAVEMEGWTADEKKRRQRLLESQVFHRACDKRLKAGQGADKEQDGN
jgi:hypothetical protein